MVVGGGGVKLMSVNSDFSKISFDSKWFVVILCLVLISGVFQVILATAIMALTPVLCYYMTSFNYGGKEARDVGLTCRCHLSNIMPDSIFYDSMGWGITFLFFVVLLFCFFKGDNDCLPQHQRDTFS